MTKATILIADDEILIAKGLQVKLEEEGYTVCAVVSSGEEAIQKAAEERPDLVLMDIVLNGPMDGIEAANQIHSRFGTPVIYVTAYSDKDILSRAKIAEPLGYLLKPFEDRELYANIKVALYKARMEAKLRESEEKLRWTFDQSPLGAAVVSLSYHFQRVNTRLCHLTGYSEQKLLSLRFPDIIHPDDLEALVEKMEALTTEDIASIKGMYAFSVRAVTRP